MSLNKCLLTAHHIPGHARNTAGNTGLVLLDKSKLNVPGATQRNKLSKQSKALISSLISPTQQSNQQLSHSLFLPIIFGLIHLGEVRTKTIPVGPALWRSG